MATSIHKLAKTVAEDTIRPVEVVEEILWSAFNALAQTLAAGERFTLSNFGTFEVRDREARTARNPHTGGTVQVAPTRVPQFRATGRLREMVRDGDTNGTIKKLPSDRKS